MLEGLATWFLNTYLGKYLENLNTDQLSIALLQGQVELENVPLRTDAFRFVDPSITVRCGIIGSIKLKIPVARLRSEPWCIDMKQVYIVVGPQKFEEYDEIIDDNLEQELKLSALDGIESEWRAEYDVDKVTSYYPSYSSWMSYGTSFIGTIIENLQLHVNDVHLRYEDDVSDLSRQCAFGFSIESLSAQTCNKNGVPQFVSREPGNDMTFKLAELNNMALYIDTDAEIYGHLPISEVKEKMMVHGHERRQCILKPVCASAWLRRNCSERPLNSRHMPRVKCDLVLNEIPLELSSQQYLCTVSGLRSLHQLRKNRRYWKWKPLTKVRENPRLWWQYAMTCHLEKIHEKAFNATWPVVLKKCRDNVLYVKAFKSYLINPVTLDFDLKQHKDNMDASMSYQELKILRELAVYHLNRERRKEDKTEPQAEVRNLSEEAHDVCQESAQQGDEGTPSSGGQQPNSASMLQRWFPMWGGWYSESAALAPDSSAQVGSNADRPDCDADKMKRISLHDEILGALADDAHAVPYKDVVFAQLSFVLKSGSLLLYSCDHGDKEKKPLFEFEFANTKVEWETRPRSRSFKFDLTLAAVYLRDKIHANSMFPLLISPQSVHGAPLCPKPTGLKANLDHFARSFQSLLQSASSPSSPVDEPFFHFMYETRPLSVPKIDYRLHVKSQPLNVVYNPIVVKHLSDFFSIPEEINRTAHLSEKIRSAAYSRLEEAKQRTKEEIRRNLNYILLQESCSLVEKRKKYDIVFDLSAPQIIVPEHFVDRQALIMVIDFGKLFFSNIEREPPSQVQDTKEPAGAADETSDNDHDEDTEEFCTPATSPKEMSTQSSVSSSKALIQDFPDLDSLDSEMSTKLYDCYTLTLKDMQVIVGRIKDNWRRAHLAGTSDLHVLDLFSINLRCERRIVSSHDPSLPSLVVSGNLPHLNVHINEDKMYILERMTSILRKDYNTLTSVSSSSQHQGDRGKEANPTSVNGDDESGLDNDGLFSSLELQVDDSSRLLYVNFCISDLWVALQSRGRNVCELEVQGLRASYTRRPLDSNVIISLNKLILIDTMQAHSCLDPALETQPCATRCRSSPVDTDKALVSLSAGPDSMEAAKVEILTLDPKCPKYNQGTISTQRFVDIDLNCLDVMFNLQTWVIVFDFCGIGSGATPQLASADAFQADKTFLTPPYRRGGRQLRSKHRLHEVRCSSPPAFSTKPAHFNSELDIKVNSLSVVLNKPEYKLACATVSDYTSKVNFRSGNFEIKGSLGKISLQDLTPQGILYKDRFLSTGDHVLKFEFFKYGCADEKLVRDHDATLRLKMSSIIYVHTQRFYSELITFFNNFNQLQSVMNKIREATSGSKTSPILPRGSRVSVSIEAASPLLLLPMSSYSSQILIINLGLLQVSNSFRFAGDEGTISAYSAKIGDSYEVQSSRVRARSRSRSRSSVSSRSVSTLSVNRQRRSPPASVQLMTARSARRIGSGSFSDHCPSTEDEDAFEDLTLAEVNHKCLLDVLSISLKSIDLKSADRLEIVTEFDMKNLTSDDIVIGEFGLRISSRKIFAEKCELQLQVERNLDRLFCHQVPDLSIDGALSKVHATIDESQYTLIRGLLAFNLGENLDDLQIVIPSKKSDEHDDSLSFSSDTIWTCIAINIQLHDVILDIVPDGLTTNLARVNFIKSRLIYESFCDSSKDVDLVSQEILLSDLRYVDVPVNQRANVFCKILQPMPHRVMNANRNPLQAEVHFRSTSESNRFTILLNNMRLMGIFDWWIRVLDFISKSAENPIPKQQEQSESGGPPGVNPNMIYMQEEAIYPTAGIVSRRAPVVECVGPVFELKINITDSDCIVVADPSQSDCATVILRSTTVIAYRPDMPDRPLSCNMNNAEVYSCILGQEDESALSIIDPVTINLEIGDRASSRAAPKGLLHLTEDNAKRQRTMEIQLQQLNIRLSYCDWLMFQNIMQSFPRHAQTAINSMESSEPSDQALVQQLRQLGFSTADCRQALDICKGHLEEAAIWLTTNARPQGRSQPEAEQVASESVSQEQVYFKGTKISFAGFEFKTTSVSICLIDDFKDVDVPLIDFNLSHLHLEHVVDGTGRAVANVSGCYYNRALSSWEPLIEPWRCSMNWRLMPIGQSGLGRKLCLNVETNDTINLNLTSSLIDMYQMIKTKWNDPRLDRRSHPSGSDAPPPLRRRTLFVPFVLNNQTGCTLWFSTQTTTGGSQFGPSRLRQQSGVSSLMDDMTWSQVLPGQQMSFSFDSKSRIRCRPPQDTKINQIVVRVDGWQEMSPVSVDHVGTYFRRAHLANCTPDSPRSIRIVYDIRLSGFARKMITLRSALTATNTLPHAISLKLENTNIKLGDVKELRLESGSRMAIPLNYVWARIFARPVLNSDLGSWRYSEKPIDWYHIISKEDNSMEIHTSRHGWNAKQEDYHFCVSVKRLNYPHEVEDYEDSDCWIQPAHSITFVPPISVINLLPCGIRFYLKNIADSSSASSSSSPIPIEPGMQSYLSADISYRLVLCFSLDLFADTADLVLPSNTSSFETLLKFRDNQNRPLLLGARVVTTYGGALKISLLSQFWIINKTGLPLVFSEEGSSTEAACQDQENEVARMATPLMFSFNPGESDLRLFSLTMRIGTGLYPDGKPQWCQPFQLQPSFQMRRVRVCPINARRVDWVHIFGIEVRVGKGRYRSTSIVTISPRFQIHNQSSFKIQCAQKCFANSFHDLEAEATHLVAFPQSSLAFHWPRLDREQLLCVRLLLEQQSGSKPHSSSSPMALSTSSCSLTSQSEFTSHWSGGFIIDKVDSFHVVVWHPPQRTFLRVEISTVGATLCIVLTDAANYPPPFRIDNFSQVTVSCIQNGLSNEELCLVVKPHHSVPYALDEPTMEPMLLCTAPGGSSAVYNINQIGEGSRLTYENFIYIGMTVTFDDEQQQLFSLAPAALNQSGCHKLVFDVEGTRVFLSSKEPGKRNQLWRMTSMGLLQHEGSSPPQDPSSHSVPSAKLDASRTVLVLDIAGTAVQPNCYTPLMLRKPDERRKLTQTWRFTDDGRLMCVHRGLFVQAKDGFLGLQKGSELVLGPPLPVCYQRTKTGVPAEQAVSRMRLRPGSGCLTVCITTDGPTRVLQIADVKTKSNSYVKLEEKDWMVIKASKRPKLISGPCRETRIEEVNASSSQSANNFELQVVVMAKSGIGLSLVSSNPPEELLYTFMSFVVIDYQSSASHKMLDGSIQNIQIDNQSWDCQQPTVLYLSPFSKSDDSRHMPALHFTVYKQIAQDGDSSAATNTDRVEIFKHLIITLKNITLNLEEELLCKVLKLFGFANSFGDFEHLDESAYEAQNAVIKSTANATRFYFGTLRFTLSQVKLSVIKSNKLSADLESVKRKLGFTLIAFGDANIDLNPFIRVHAFETLGFLTNAIVEHYQAELLSQAVLILGSTDVLGNPIGFLNDLSEGVSCLVSDGNVGGLVKNLVHGAANSAAKLSGTLSWSISKATLDERYDEKRQMWHRRHGDKSKEYFIAGLKGLGFGMLGGLTSVVTETYDGISREGVGGFFTGFGWGLVGTISKPTIGVLDFVAGSAIAVKESSRSISKKLPPKMRPSRVVVGSNGSLPVYSRKDGLGQEQLFRMNGRNFIEVYVGHEKLRTGQADLQILISRERIIVYSVVSKESDKGENSVVESVKPVLSVHMSELVCARVVTFKDVIQSQEVTLAAPETEKFYVELVLKMPKSSMESQKRPQVRCDSDKMARSVVQQMNHARRIYQDMTQTVTDDHELDLVTAHP